jgi:hypothetical protein
MSGRWTYEEDEFLLRWHNVGADFVAYHDLNRAMGAGSRRMEKLTKSGARKLFAEMKLKQIEFEEAVGRHRAKFSCITGEHEKEYWRKEASGDFYD